MADNNENTVKIRFKFRSGEEFEAEGSPDFIEKQRADFLQLIGKEGARSTPRTAHPNPNRSISKLSQQSPVSSPVPPNQALPLENSSYFSTGSEPQSVTPSFEASANKPNTAFSEYTQPPMPANLDNYRLWEEIVRTEDGLVFLRRKSRLLAPDTAALVLLAAAKVLLREENGYGALALSKSLKKSGYGGDRLDRILGGEMRQNTVKAEGSKRSRHYILSDEGFARAYVLAGKLAAEMR